MAEKISALLTDYMKEQPLISWDLRCFSDGKSLLDSGHDFDLILLDIQMKDLNGMETAKRLRQRGSQCILIFLTVLKEWVFDAFAVQAFDYLVKPLEPNRFYQTLNRAMAALKQREQALLPKLTSNILIQRGSSREIIPLSRIRYCEVLGRKVYLHQSDGSTIDYYERLEVLEHQVDQRFFRCHRSYLVNLDYVRGCDAGQVILTEQEKIPVSRLRERDFLQALLHHMKGRDTF